MKKLIEAFLFILILLIIFFSVSNAQNIQSSIRDKFSYNNGDSLHTKLLWIRAIGQPGNGTGIVQGSAIQPYNSNGVGGPGVYNYGIVVYDSVYNSDSIYYGFTLPERSNMDNYPDSYLMYSGPQYIIMQVDTTRYGIWNGVCWQISPADNGRFLYWFRRISNGAITPQNQGEPWQGWQTPVPADGKVPNPSGLATDTIWFKQTGNIWTLYVNSVPWDTITIPGYSLSRSRIVMASAISAIPNSFDNFIMGKLGSVNPPTPPASISRDTVKPQIIFQTSSLSTDSSQSFTFIISVIDSNTSTQKSPGLDSLRIYFGPQGGSVVESLSVNLNHAPYYTATKVFSKKPIGNYEIWARIPDDSLNITISPKTYVTVGAIQSQPFVSLGYYPYWGYIRETPSNINYNAFSILINFYTNIDSTRVPYVGVMTGGFSAISDSEALTGAVIYDPRTGFQGHNFQQELIDSCHRKGKLVLLGISAITYYNPSTARHLSAIIQDSTKVKVLARGIGGYLKRRGYDGIDMNWEYPTANDKQYEARFFRILRDTLDFYLGKHAYITITGENLTSAIDAQNYDVAAINQYLDMVLVESGARVSGHGGTTTGNPMALYHPGASQANPSGSTCPTFDSFTYADSVYQALPQYVTSNGWLKAGMQKNKISQFISLYPGRYNGITGPCQATSRISGYFVDLYSVMIKDYYNPSREIRDQGSRAHYLSWTDGSGDHMIEFEDSISIADKISLLKSRGFSSATFYELTQGYIAAVDYGGNYFKITSNRNYLENAIASAIGSVSTPAQMAAPTQVSLSNGSTGVSAPNVNLVWRKVFSSNGYTISLSPISDFSQLVTPINNQLTENDTIAIFLSLNPSTTYYWKVSSKQGSSIAATSPVWIFTMAGTSVSSNPPSQPTLVYPNDGVAGQDNNITLRWRRNPVSDTVVSYWIQAGSDPTFVGGPGVNQIVSDSNKTDTLFTTSNLSSLQVVYWRVRAKNLAGWSTWSNPRSFTVRSITIPPVSGYSSSPLLMYLKPGGGIDWTPLNAYPFKLVSDSSVQKSSDSTLGMSYVDQSGVQSVRLPNGSVVKSGTPTFAGVMNTLNSSDQTFTRNTRVTNLEVSTSMKVWVIPDFFSIDPIKPPFNVYSDHVVPALNADQLDSAHAYRVSTPNGIPRADASGKISSGWFTSSGGTMTRSQILDSLQLQLSYTVPDTFTNRIALIDSSALNSNPMSMLDINRRTRSHLSFSPGDNASYIFNNLSNGALILTNTGAGLTGFEISPIYGLRGVVSGNASNPMQFKVRAMRGGLYTAVVDTNFEIADSANFLSLAVGSDGALKTGSQISGSGTFSGTATTANVTIQGASTTDLYYVTLTGNAAPLAADAFRCNVTSTGFTLTRSSSGTSGLGFMWMRTKK